MPSYHHPEREKLPALHIARKPFTRGRNDNACSSSCWGQGLCKCFTEFAELIKIQKDCCIWTHYLLCKRQGWYHCTTKTQVTEILKLNPKFTEFNESSVQFRESPLKHPVRISEHPNLLFLICSGNPELKGTHRPNLVLSHHSWERKLASEL